MIETELTIADLEKAPDQQLEVEKVFAVPGIGRHFVDAVLAKDITLIMGVVLVYSTMLVLFNLAVDALYSWIDPRIRI